MKRSVSRERVASNLSGLFGSSGRWAGEQLMKALQSGQQISPAALRTLDTLRKDEWVYFDEALVEAAQIRLRGVADLMGAGLVKNVVNGLAKTVFQYEKVTDMEPATVSLDGLAETEGDRQEFELNSLPLPITHKDFYINLRTLMASRERGESLDTTQIRTAGRLIAETVESMLFNGGKTFASMPIYGYTTHPDRNTVDLTTAWDDPGVNGEEILADVLTMIAAAEADRMFGPFWLYVPSNYSVKLEADFKANSDRTIRQRLLEVDRLERVTVVDQLAEDNVVLVQATQDTVVMVIGENLQTVQWDVSGGFRINFKGFTIQVPLIRSDSDQHCGVVHLRTAP